LLPVTANIMGTSSRQKPSSMKRMYGIVLVCCCIALLWNPPGSCDEAARPILSLDLRKFEHCTRPPARDLRAYTFLQDSVAFLDDGTLAVSRTINLGFLRQTVVSCVKDLGFSFIRGTWCGIWRRGGGASSLLAGKLRARTGDWAGGTPLPPGAGWVDADQCARQGTRAPLWSGRSTM
jgi:hypothetical protein